MFYSKSKSSDFFRICNCWFFSTMCLNLSWGVYSILVFSASMSGKSMLIPKLFSFLRKKESNSGFSTCRSSASAWLSTGKCSRKLVSIFGNWSENNRNRETFPLASIVLANSNQRGFNWSWWKSDLASPVATTYSWSSWFSSFLLRNLLIEII